MNYIKWGKDFFNGKQTLNNCIVFENAPPKKLIQNILNEIQYNTIIGIYFKYDYLTDNVDEYGYELLTKDINTVWNFYLEYPDIFYYTILTTPKQDFILSVELGSDKNILCGKQNILDLIPDNNDFSIFREY